MIRLEAELLHAVGEYRVARPRAYKRVKDLKLGALVYFEDQLVGKLVDIIGPVKKPRLVIKPLRPMRVEDVSGILVEVRSR